MRDEKYGRVFPFDTSFSSNEKWNFLTLGDTKLDSLDIEKIAGYQLINRLNRYCLCGWEVPPTVPTPFLVYPLKNSSFKENIRNVDSLISKMEDKVIYDFTSSGHPLIAIRAATTPHKDNLPSFKLDVRKNDFRQLFSTGVRQMIDYAGRSEFSVFYFYIHPWVEPRELKASADIYVSIEKGLAKIVLTYGCGNTLEFGGDAYVVDLNKKLIVASTMTCKKIYYKAIDPISKNFLDKPRGFPVPLSLQNAPVLTDAKVLDLAEEYFTLAKQFQYPIRAHWTSVNDTEEFTIDFQRWHGETVQHFSGNKLSIIKLCCKNDVSKIKNSEKHLYILEPAIDSSPTDFFDLISFIQNGVICSNGGVTCHPSIIARELHLPYLHIDENTEEFKDGDKVMIVEIDGKNRLRKVD
jgi:phosphohistidine swiveling domain-containing protein